MRRRDKKRRGKILLMTALMLPALFGLIALAADVAMLTTARAQLSTVADAAALAGVMQLADEMRVRGSTNLSTEKIAARSRAQSVGQMNKVINTAAIINQNTTNDPNGDVVIGYVNPATPKAAIQTSSGLEPLFNTVLVRATRDADHGGPIPAFFSKIWGNTGTSETVTAEAMAENFPVQGFRPSGSTPANSPNANLLPIVLDVTTYNAMMARTTTDQYSYDSATNTVTSGADGITESLLYPVASGSPGNWNTINVGVSSNGTSTLSAQIQNGISPDEMATYPNSKIALDYGLNPPSITFSGNPGISAGLKSALESIIGKPVAIPIYDQSGGNGNNAWYRVIAFQTCRIVSVNFQGNPKHMIIQPCLLRDSTAIPLTDTTKWPTNWSWQSGGLVRVHLTQ